uniref:hypothetical protein n=1 Tax=Orrella sp. TaxID=1921583 RepID=UPI0040485FFE
MTSITLAATHALYAVTSHQTLDRAAGNQTPLRLTCNASHSAGTRYELRCCAMNVYLIDLDC